MPHNWKQLGAGCVCDNCGWQASAELAGVPDECIPQPKPLPLVERTQDELNAIMQICRTCEHFRVKGGPPCKLCRTCPESRKHFESQMKWTHKHCPANPPKW